MKETSRGVITDRCDLSDRSTPEASSDDDLHDHEGVNSNTVSSRPLRDVLPRQRPPAPTMTNPKGGRRNHKILIDDCAPLRPLPTPSRNERERMGRTTKTKMTASPTSPMVVEEFEKVRLPDGVFSTLHEAPAPRSLASSSTSSTSSYRNPGQDPLSRLGVGGFIPAGTREPLQQPTASGSYQQLQSDYAHLKKQYDERVQRCVELREEAELSRRKAVKFDLLEADFAAHLYRLCFDRWRGRLQRRAAYGRRERPSSGEQEDDDEHEPSSNIPVEELESAVEESFAKLKEVRTEKEVLQKENASLRAALEVLNADQHRVRTVDETIAALKQSHEQEKQAILEQHHDNVRRLQEAVEKCEAETAEKEEAFLARIRLLEAGARDVVESAWKDANTHVDNCATRMVEIEEAKAKALCEAEDRNRAMQLEIGRIVAEMGTKIRDLEAEKRGLIGEVGEWVRGVAKAVALPASGAPDESSGAGAGCAAETESEDATVTAVEASRTESAGNGEVVVPVPGPPGASGAEDVEVFEPEAEGAGTATDNDNAADSDMHRILAEIRDAIGIADDEVLDAELPPREDISEDRGGVASSTSAGRSNESARATTSAPAATHDNAPERQKQANRAAVRAALLSRALRLRKTTETLQERSASDAQRLAVLLEDKESFDLQLERAEECLIEVQAACRRNILAIEEQCAKEVAELRQSTVGQVPKHEFEQRITDHEKDCVERILEAQTEANRRLQELGREMRRKEEDVVALCEDVSKVLKYMMETNVEASGGPKPVLRRQDILPEDVFEHLGLSAVGVRIHDALLGGVKQASAELFAAKAEAESGFYSSSCEIKPKAASQRPSTNANGIGIRAEDAGGGGKQEREMDKSMSASVSENECQEQAGSQTASRPPRAQSPCTPREEEEDEPSLNNSPKKASGSSAAMEITLKYLQRGSKNRFGGSKKAFVSPECHSTDELADTAAAAVFAAEECGVRNVVVPRRSMTREVDEEAAPAEENENEAKVERQYHDVERGSGEGAALESDSKLLHGPAGAEGEAEVAGEAASSQKNRHVDDDSDVAGSTSTSWAHWGSLLFSPAPVVSTVGVVKQPDSKPPPPDEAEGEDDRARARVSSAGRDILEAAQLEENYMMNAAPDVVPNKEGCAGARLHLPCAVDNDNRSALREVEHTPKNNVSVASSSSSTSPSALNALARWAASAQSTSRASSCRGREDGDSSRRNLDLQVDVDASGADTFEQLRGEASGVADRVLDSSSYRSTSSCPDDEPAAAIETATSYPVALASATRKLGRWLLPRGFGGTEDNTEDVAAGVRLDFIQQEAFEKSSSTEDQTQSVHVPFSSESEDANWSGRSAPPADSVATVFLADAVKALSKQLAEQQQRPEQLREQAPGRTQRQPQDDETAPLVAALRAYESLQDEWRQVAKNIASGCAYEFPCGWTLADVHAVRGTVSLQKVLRRTMTMSTSSTSAGRNLRPLALSLLMQPCIGDERELLDFDPEWTLQLLDGEDANSSLCGSRAALDDEIARWRDANGNTLIQLVEYSRKVFQLTTGRGDAAVEAQLPTLAGVEVYLKSEFPELSRVVVAPNAAATAGGPAQAHYLQFTADLLSTSSSNRPRRDAAGKTTNVSDTKISILPPVESNPALQEAALLSVTELDRGVRTLVGVQYGMELNVENKISVSKHEALLLITCERVVLLEVLAAAAASKSGSRLVGSSRSYESCAEAAATDFRVLLDLPHREVDRLLFFCSETGTTDHALCLLKRTGTSEADVLLSVDLVEQVKNVSALCAGTELRHRVAIFHPAHVAHVEDVRVGSVGTDNACSAGSVKEAKLAVQLVQSSPDAGGDDVEQNDPRANHSAGASSPAVEGLLFVAPPLLAVDVDAVAEPSVAASEQHFRQSEEVAPADKEAGEVEEGAGVEKIGDGRNKNNKKRRNKKSKRSPPPNPKDDDHQIESKTLVQSGVEEPLLEERQEAPPGYEEAKRGDLVRSPNSQVFEQEQIILGFGYCRILKNQQQHVDRQGGGSILLPPDDRSKSAVQGSGTWRRAFFLCTAQKPVVPKSKSEGVADEKTSLMVSKLRVEDLEAFPEAEQDAELEKAFENKSPRKNVHFSFFADVSDAAGFVAGMHHPENEKLLDGVSTLAEGFLSQMPLSSGTSEAGVVGKAREMISVLRLHLLQRRTTSTGSPGTLSDADEVCVVGFRKDREQKRYASLMQEAG